MASNPEASGPFGLLAVRLAGAVIRLAAKLSDQSRRVKQVLIASGDAGLLVVSVWIAYSLRISQWVFIGDPVLIMIAVGFAFAAPVFYLTGVYRTIFRFAGIGMLRNLLRAFLIYGVLTTLTFTILGIAGVPRTMGILQPIVFFGLVAGARGVVRYLVTELAQRDQFGGEARAVLIYGAGEAGQQLCHSLRSDPSMSLVGFIDDEAGRAGQRLDGYKVYRSDKLQYLIDEYGVVDVFLAIPEVSRRRRREIIAELKPYRVRVLTLPRARDIIDGRVSFDDIRPLDIEDLLGREAMRPDPKLLGRTVVGKTVLVSGAGGSIGSELCRQILRIGARKLVLLENSEFSLYEIERELLAYCAAHPEITCQIVAKLGSVNDPLRLDFLFSSIAIDTVYHAAAYKHVPLVEANPVEGIQNNVMGTYEMVRAADTGGVSDFILVSTDKAVRPTNVMGATKRSAEQILQSFADLSGKTRYSMVRFGNVLGSSGSVVPLFRNQIRAGGPITLTHNEVERYFMTIPEAANLVIQAGGMAQGGEVFVLDMGKPVKIGDLARTMVQLSGLTVQDDANPDGDIAIEEVGLRPGEKLYEELLIGNSPTATQHPRIMMAHERFIPWPRLEGLIEELRVCRSREIAIALLSQLVPEFEHCRDNDARTVVN